MEPTSSMQQPDGLLPTDVVSGFRAGQKLLARYRLERVLGHGGMGVVWLARDEELDLEVALKFLPELVVNDRASLNDLKRETRRTLELTHPNIVRTYDFVQDNRVAGISMEYVDSDTLRNLRLDQPDGVFQCDQIAEWTRQLCVALHYAHTQAAIVHRDLKPANLMVNRKGQLKITDFGISRSLVESVTQMTANGGVSGTLVYMSPQQLSGEPASPLDDVYAVGATIYELLTTRPPFYAGDITGQIHRKIPPSIAERRTILEIPAGRIPPEWESTVAACLAKEASQRPQSALEIAARLGLTGPVPITSTLVVLPNGPSNRGGGPASQPTEHGTGSLPEGSIFTQRQTAPPSTPPASPKKSALLAIGASFLVALFLLVGGSALFLLRDQKPAVAPSIPGHPPEPARASGGPASAKSAPSAGPRGSLMITTEPSGASIRVGDLRAERSPYPFDELGPGPVTVVVSAEGYEPKTIQAVIEANKLTNPGLIKLERSQGSLRVVSEPEGLTYEIRSHTNPPEITRGTTPAGALDLPAGDYEVTLSREGWPAQTHPAVVRSHEEHVERFEFVSGSVTLDSEPKGATILQGDQEMGKTPTSLTEPPGAVKFTLKLTGYEPATVVETAVAGQVVEHPVVTLAKIAGAAAQKSAVSHPKPKNTADNDDDDRPHNGVGHKIKEGFKSIGHFFHK